uniref:Retrotransposon gag domain-containing protein n=1 Tax=Cajanus cajan TaxID=3821 RepID=A0A151UBB0_CAJCA|nr:hypothetical protein KK1_020816 [Cajanus cajan]
MICNSIRYQGVPGHTIKLTIFPFSLSKSASYWLKSFPTNSFTTWDDLANNFLEKYFPLEKIKYYKMTINNFQQEADESLSKAWDRTRTC